MKKKEMWIRRIVSTTVLVVIVLLVIFGVSKLLGKSGADKAKESQSEQSDQASLDIPVCAAKDLNAGVSFEPPVTYVGQETQVALQLRNIGTTPCQMDTANLQLRMVTGEDEVWQGGQCSGNWDKLLLLDIGQEWGTKLTWDGHIYNDCVAVTNDEDSALWAASGTYQLLVNYSGAPLTSQTLVVE